MKKAIFWALRRGARGVKMAGYGTKTDYRGGGARTVTAARSAKTCKGGQKGRVQRAAGDCGGAFCVGGAGRYRPQAGGTGVFTMP